MKSRHHQYLVTLALGLLLVKVCAQNTTDAADDAPTSVMTNMSEAPATTTGNMVTSSPTPTTTTVAQASTTTTTTSSTPSTTTTTTGSTPPTTTTTTTMTTPQTLSSTTTATSVTTSATMSNATATETSSSALPSTVVTTAASTMPNDTTTTVQPMSSTTATNTSSVISSSTTATSEMPNSTSMNTDNPTDDQTTSDMSSTDTRDSPTPLISTTMSATASTRMPDIPDTCDRPPSAVNAAIKPILNVYNDSSTVTYSCLDKHASKCKSMTVTCTNGVWKYGSCLPVCLEVETPGESSIIDQYNPYFVPAIAVAGGVIGLGIILAFIGCMLYHFGKCCKRREEAPKIRSVASYPTRSSAPLSYYQRDEILDIGSPTTTGFVEDKSLFNRAEEIDLEDHTDGSRASLIEAPAPVAVVTTDLDAEAGQTNGGAENALSNGDLTTSTTLETQNEKNGDEGASPDSVNVEDKPENNNQQQEQLI